MFKLLKVHRLYFKGYDVHVEEYVTFYSVTIWRCGYEFPSLLDYRVNREKTSLYEAVDKSFSSMLFDYVS